MKRDAEVLVMLRERAKGRTQEQAATRAGMSVRTVREYERRAKLPSQLKQPRTYRSRANPFADDWPWITTLLKDDPALQGQTVFGLLCDRHPGRYQEGQLRTLQRHIAAWRAQYGPNRDVMFPQVHEPGEAAQSDFTYMNSLGVTLGGVPFPHMVYHLVLVYSNMEAVQICFSESFEALVEGFETCVWQLGGVPRQHRTDHLSAAIHPLDEEGRAQAKERYRVLMVHYGLEPTTNNLGVAHENGDVEHEHRQFKRGGLGMATSLSGAIDDAVGNLKQAFLRVVANDDRSPLQDSRSNDVTLTDGRIHLVDHPWVGETYGAILARHELDELAADGERTPPTSSTSTPPSGSFAAWFAEVRVDTELGLLRIARLVSAVDAGRILNEKLARSQIIGGAVMGIGMTMLEETIFDSATGRIANATFGDYLVPVNADVPDIDVVFVGKPDEVRPIGLKGVGELGVIGVSAAITNAVYHASGRRIRSLPITIDQLLLPQEGPCWHA